ncbi:MAG: hypothetical protein JNL32_16020, partial [Candidatus Kapabacteria bacterium]|nr:hypothetical protein [Candidatus Kapabacteria bacterium]
PIGASSDALDLKVQDADKNAVSGTGSMYTVDGRDAYGLNLTTRNRSASYLKQNTTDKGTPVPLTVSRSLAVVASYFGAPSSNAVVLYSECVPHNGSVIDWRDSKWNVLIRAAGISSALYMRSSNLPARMNTPSDSRYITPVASVAAKVDGQQLRFDSLTGYINHMNSRAGKYYETERTIDVPYLCGFSRSSDGSNPSFNEIALGCEIIYDGVSYIVLGIERDYASITTKLRLQASSRFVFQEVGTIEEAGGGEGLPTLPPDSPVATQQSGISGAYLAAGDITAGDAVMLNSAGAVLRATAISGAVYGRVIGVSLQTVVAGSRVQVALPDSVVSSSRYSFTPGGRVYVRTIALPSANLSQELLTASNATLGEDTIVELGVAISVSAFVLDTPEYIIREELM